MQKRLIGIFFGFLAVFVLLIASDSAANAIVSNRSDNASDAGKTKKLTQSLEKKATRASEFAENACEVHVRVIKQRQENIAAHAEKTANRLNKLTLAVQNFYTEKLVPQGKIAPNYDSLVADVSSKQAALTPLIEKVKADSEGLTCEKGQQRTQFTTFRQDWQALLKGFKDYKQSVLTLMQAVRKAAGGSGGEASSSAETN